jgi:hypothetical protein
MATKDSSANGLRWAARITGSVMIAFTLFMAIGYHLEGREKHPDAAFLSGLTPLIIIMFIFWGMGLAGLIIGWWKERPGGYLSMLCFIVVAILNLFNPEAPSRTGAIIPMMIFCIPSVLFIACGLTTDKGMRPKKEEEAE